MVDRVRPLKFETSQYGTQNDEYQTELNPLEDYVSCKGISLENSINDLIDKDPVSGEMRFKDPINGIHLMSEFLATASGANSFNYIFSRKGNSDTNSFLKVGNKIPSNEAGFICPITAHRVIISASCEELTTGTVLLYVKKVNTTTHISGYGGLVFTNERTKYIDIPTMTTTLNPGDEIAAKIVSGSFENLLLHVRIIQ